MEGLSPGDAALEAQEAIRTTEPDRLVALGDRFEILSACIPATLAGVGVVHIHGGERTTGSLDDRYRDAITRLSSVHCVANVEFANRAATLGARKIHVTGAPGLDNLRRLPGRRPGKYFVVTYHPETESRAAPSGAFAVVGALQAFPDHEVYWTGVNNDPGRDDVLRAFAGYEECRWSYRKYIDMCRNAACVVGNSSSGLIEMPTLEVPTVDVGMRQCGRPRGPSVYHADNDTHSIRSAINAALNHAGPFDNPYGGFGASEKIAEIALS